MNWIEDFLAVKKEADLIDLLAHVAGTIDRNQSYHHAKLADSAETAICAYIINNRSVDGQLLRDMVADTETKEEAATHISKFCTDLIIESVMAGLVSEGIVEVSFDEDKTRYSLSPEGEEFAKKILDDLK